MDEKQQLFRDLIKELINKDVERTLDIWFEHNPNLTGLFRLGFDRTSRFVVQAYEGEDNDSPASRGADIFAFFASETELELLREVAEKAGVVLFKQTDTYAKFPRYCTRSEILHSQLDSDNG